MKTVNLKTGMLEYQNSESLNQLISFGSRMNLKRGFLFVSKVLGKHLPTKPSIMEKNFKDLANLIKVGNEKTLVIGFAETATALGHGVFEALNLENGEYIHTTRYNFSHSRLIEFMEEHSHAPSHILYKPKSNISEIKNIILVDDEVSTGKTTLNIVKELKKVFPNVQKYSLVSMLNWSNLENDEIEFFSLFSGKFNFQKKNYSIPENLVSESQNSKTLDKIIKTDFGRFGMTQKLAINFEILLHKIDLGKKILVLGTGEFMYPPYLLAKYLEDKGLNSYFQASTRSPINIDGIIKSKISFKDNYFENIDNFVYNIANEKYDKILICYETNKIPTNHNLKIILEKNLFSVTEIFF